MTALLGMQTHINTDIKKPGSHSNSYSKIKMPWSMVRQVFRLTLTLLILTSPETEHIESVQLNKNGAYDEH